MNEQYSPVETSHTTPVVFRRQDAFNLDNPVQLRCKTLRGGAFRNALRCRSGDYQTPGSGIRHLRALRDPAPGHEKGGSASGSQDQRGAKTFAVSRGGAGSFGVIT